jgi:hypothetical protein
MAGIFASRKEQICTDLISIFDGLTRAASHRRDCAKAWRELGKATYDMAISQIPEFEEPLKGIKDCFFELSDIHIELAGKEERNAEDVRDVIERYYVIYRVNEEYVKARHAYDDATADLQEVQRKYQTSMTASNQSKLEASLISAKGKKSAALYEVKVRLAALIQAKDAYNKFKVRRFKHGWNLYGQGMKTVSEKEIVVFTKVRKHLAEIAEFGPEGQETAMELKEKVEELEAAQNAGPQAEDVAPVEAPASPAQEAFQVEEEPVTVDTAYGGELDGWGPPKTDNPFD